MSTQQFFDQLLIFVNLHQHTRNQFILSVHFSDTVNFRVQRPDWLNRYFNHAQLKKFSNF